MVKYKEKWLALKEQLEGSEGTGMACPLCDEEDIKSELIWYNSGELVCENEKCSFDKTIWDILEGYYFHKSIGSLESVVEEEKDIQHVSEKTDPFPEHLK